MLMDINMFPVNGFEATRKIVKSCPEIKIIGVSVNEQLGYARNMFQLGAKGFVTKNTSQAEMIQAILEVHKGKTFLCSELKEKKNFDAE
jgi:DNA-binding NarL/FixJ family response regulator